MASLRTQLWIYGQRLKGSLFPLWLTVVISGACSLTYQVVWHRYLMILLGSQAQATAIVLGLFLAGLGLGYHYFGRVSAREKKLWKWYARIELGIVLWAALFPMLYKFAYWLCGICYRYLGVTNLLTDILISALLLLPPTFLMGGTLPVLTEMFGRRIPNASRVHAKIYGWNTLGAAIGCFIAGFFLIPAVGIRGGSWAAAFCNLLALVIFVLAFRKLKDAPKKANKADHSKLTLAQKFLLVISVLSGFYVFSLETVLIRIVGLSTGSSHHHFALVVSIFILALGVGSLLARKIANYRWMHLAVVQFLAVVLLAGVYLSAGHWPYWGHLARIAFRDEVQNYYLYQGLLGLGLGLILFIPLCLCGVILPICFHLFSRESNQLGKRVGVLYGLNTLGAVLGAVFGGYLLFYLFDLDQLFILCIFCIITGLGISLFHLLRLHGVVAKSVGFFALLAMAVGVWKAPRFDRHLYIQPFRQDRPVKASYQGKEAFSAFLKGRTEYKFYKDDPNTSVGVGASSWDGKERSLSIFVNGKSDGNTNGDLFTTVMLGHIPGLLSPTLENVAIIGFGTGMTIGEMALYKDVKHIDVAEISPVLLKKAAPMFDPYNRNVTKNPKVQFHNMDAFRFLVGTQTNYDVIISEPSNPWVTGIENLFSDEFYSLARRKLKESGLFVQWIHTYSFSPELFYMVLRTMKRSFPNITIFQLKGRDYALVGSPKTFEQEDVLRMFSRYDKEIEEALTEYGMKSVEAVMALEVSTSGITNLMASSGPIHTLEQPRLSHGAQKSFFAGHSLMIHEEARKIREYYAYVKEQSLLSIYTGRQGLNESNIEKIERTFCGDGNFKAAHLCESAQIVWKLINPAVKSDFVDRHVATLNLLNHGPKGKEGVAAQSFEMLEFYKKNYTPIALLPEKSVEKALDWCIEVTSPKSPDYGECLLQRILFNISVQLETDGVKVLVEKFNHWFEALDPASENYSKFLNAKDILKDLVKL